MENNCRKNTGAKLECGEVGSTSIPPLLSPCTDSDVESNSGICLNESDSALNTQETFFGYVRDTVDCYILVEAVVAGLLRPYTGASGSVRNGTVLVIPLDSRPNKFMDHRQWSAAKTQGSFKVTREVEAVNTFRHSSSAIKTRRNSCAGVPGAVFPTCTARFGTRIKDQGLMKKSLSMNGSDGHLYRVISYSYPKDVEHFHKLEPATNRLSHFSPLQCPSQICQYQQFITKWVQYNKLRKMREQIESELVPLPPSVFPVENLAPQPEDNWELSVTPRPDHYYQLQQGENGFISFDEMDSLLPLSLPPSILPLNQPKEVAVEQIRQALLREQRIMQQNNQF
ncbi:hypothetical protein BDR26DRAFT_1011210 [Obelidium mucronatum]|nr:hypothetical protein BDR26DRAFT_1011210 [Obelidium mucronatum]